MKLENVSKNARSLGDDEVRELLEGPHMSRLATTRRDGRPHIAPMFFLYRDGLFYFWQRKSARKQKIVNIQHNPNVMISVDTCSAPYRAVLVEGTADLTEENADEIAMAIGEKYGGADGRETIRRHREESPLWLIRVRPTRIMHFET